MTELWNAYWPMILIGVAIGLIVGLIIFRRPKQKVTLSKAETPVRPHMAAVAVSAEPAVPAGSAAPAMRDTPEGNGVGDEMAAAVSDVVGQVIGAHVHDELPGAVHAGGAGDDLQRMKGVGPKLASLLQGRGLTRFEQIAALSADEVAALDQDLGAFKGRLTRDRVVEQAGFLARGDQAGYEAAFGRL